MLGREQESGLKRPQEAAAGVAFNSAPTTSFTTTTGHVITVSEYISRFDEAAKKRLHNMNQKLRELEMQMEALEAEITKAHDSTNRT